MNKLHQLCMTLICLLCLLSATSVLAATSVSKDRSGLPITVKSNEMNADNKGKTAIFSGKVVAKQGDLTIFSDKLVVSYADKKGDVDKVEAIGNVRIIQQNRTGFADQALY